MGSYSIASTSSTKKVSNFQSLLHSLTPNVPLRPVPANCIEILDKDLNPSGKQINEYFTLMDVWGCMEECSAYGQGTPVTLTNGDNVIQYFTPYVSAVHLTRNKKIKKEDTVINGSANGTKSSSTDESKSNNLLSSSSNSSTQINLRNFSSGESNNAEDCITACLFDSYFKFYDSKKPFDRVPFFRKIQELAQIYPDLMTLRSIDLSPSSWMAIAWYPIYHIPNNGAVIKDFSTAFITFHKLSSFHQDDTNVDSSRNGIGGSKAIMDNNKYPIKMGHPPMPLYPFALAAKRLVGDVWFKLASDKQRYNDLNKIATNWVHKRNFFHYDFNQFSCHVHIQNQIGRS